MKKSQLRQIIKEEISKVLKEDVSGRFVSKYLAQFDPMDFEIEDA